MALIVLPEQFLCGERHEFSFNQLRMGKTLLSSAGVVICDSGESLFFQTHFLGACEHRLMRKPFILSESGEGKTKTKVLLLETDEPHRLYIQKNTDCSQAVMF